MEITPWQILFTSISGIMLVALFGILFRQGQSPTRKEMHELHQELRTEMQAQVKEAVDGAVREITADTNRQINEVNQRIDALRQDINRVLAALASHEHVDGRVMMTVQPEAEPAQAAGN